MPLYEYECENCGDLFEVIQKFADEPLTMHEKCGGKVHRILSAPALQFKGSGWYVNDYAKGGNAGAPSSKKTNSGSEGASSSSDSSSSATPASTSADKSSSS
ncbi:MAG: FmdB family zinc ribbon protein [Bryobacteraceae bacterium]